MLWTVGGQRADRGCVESRVSGLRGDAFAHDRLRALLKQSPRAPGATARQSPRTVSATTGLAPLTS
jgi:hypothetical protein